jgi:hypothetical protein
MNNLITKIPEFIPAYEVTVTDPDMDDVIEADIALTGIVFTDLL